MRIFDLMRSFIVLGFGLFIAGLIIMPYTRYGAVAFEAMQHPNYVGNGCTFNFELPGPPPSENANREAWREDDAFLRRSYAINVAHYWAACTPPPTAENQHMPVESIR